MQYSFICYLSILRIFKTICALFLTHCFIHFEINAENKESVEKGEEAIKNYRQLIRKEECLNDAVSIWLKIAEIYRKKHELEASLNELNALDTLIPNDDVIKQTKFELLTEMAQEEIKKGNNKKAIDYFKQALEAEPKSRMRILLPYATQLTETFQSDLAIPLYQEILNSNPTEEEKKNALVGLAKAYIEKENYQEAIKISQQIIAMDPQIDLYDFYLALAKNAASHQKPEISVEYYKKAMDARPSERIKLLRDYATQLSYAYHGDQAIPLYKELLDSNISVQEKRLARLDLAQTYIWTKQFSLAINEYETLLSLDPQDDEARKKLINLFINFAQFDAKNFNHISAINWYLNAMALDPNLINSLLLEYTEEVSKSGQGLVAIDLYKKIIANCPTREILYRAKLGLAQAYIWMNKHEEALKIYDELLLINPNDSEVRKRKAQVYIDYARYDASKGDRNQAIIWFKKALEIDGSRKGEILRELADQLRYNQQNDEAISLYKELLTFQLNEEVERSVRLGLAQAYINKFQYEDALKEYDYLLQKNRFDFIARQGKAKVYLDYANYNAKLNKHQEAIEWYNKAIENDPIIRSELMLKIEEQRNLLSGNKINEPLKTEEISPQPEGMIPWHSQSENKTTVIINTPTPLKDNVEKQEEKKTITPSGKNNRPQTVPTQKSIPKTDSCKLNNKTIPLLDSKEIAKKSYDQAIEYAKELEVFKANRAFERSIYLDPTNRSYRESYAWHLQAFSFHQEASEQFLILLPEAKDPTLFFQSLGWDFYFLGKLNEALWAFSHAYFIPCDYSLRKKFTSVTNQFRRDEYQKLNTLWCDLSSHYENPLEAKKKLFESYVYLREVELASLFAEEILFWHPQEYRVHFQYADLLFQKRMFRESLYQYCLLIEKLPNHSFLYLSLGKVYEALGCLCSAKLFYEAAFSLDSNSYTDRAYARILAKLNECCEAEMIAQQNTCTEEILLVQSLSSAEVQLHCGSVENASAIYRNILSEYPYNRDALWGLLKSSTYTGNTHDALISYKSWPTVWFEDPIQNWLAVYYRPHELIFSGEYFSDITTFRRFSVGAAFNQYGCMDSRFHAGYYYTQFAQNHFNTINRHSGFLAWDKFFEERWEVHIRWIENYYDRLQHQSEESVPCHEHYQKGVSNCRLHLSCHVTPEFFADIGYDYYDVIDTIPPFNNPIYNYSNQIGSATLNIRTSDWNVFFNYYKERFSWLANFVIGHYSDGNVKQTRSFRMDYRFCDLPEFTVYYSYFYLNFKNPAPLFQQCNSTEVAYYDPINLEIHSLGLDVSYESSDQLETGGEVAILYLPKANNFAYSAYGYTNYKMTDQWSLRVDLRYFYQARDVLRNEVSGFYHASSANIQLLYQF